MEELNQVKMAMAGIKFSGKNIIETMIKDSEIELKKPENKNRKKDIIIELHNSINELVIADPTNEAFKVAKSRMDNIVISLR